METNNSMGRFRMGRVDMDSEILMSTIFNGLNNTNEDLIVITIDSYRENKIFTLKYEDLPEFSNNYRYYLGENMNFIQPLDYIFF